MSEIIETIEKLFIVRKDCYPKQIDNENSYIVVKKPFTTELIEEHLKGKITLGCWQVEPIKKTVNWICFDFDGVVEEEFEKAKKISFKLRKEGFNPIMEFSGRRGYHIWLFIEPTKLEIARKFVLGYGKDFGVADVYPRSDKMSDYGAQVKMPIGIHRASWKRSYFLDENFNILSQGKGEELLTKIYINKRDSILLTKKDNSLKNFIKKGTLKCGKL